MSSIVADELAKIKSFGSATEKRRSSLTLNELNYISDKQLHKIGGSGGDAYDGINAVFKLREDVDPIPTTGTATIFELEIVKVDLSDGSLEYSVILGENGTFMASKMHQSDSYYSGSVTFPTTIDDTTSVVYFLETSEPPEGLLPGHAYLYIDSK